jgi:hypothetical protein
MRAIDADQLYEFFKKQRSEQIEACRQSGTEYAAGRLSVMCWIMGLLKDERFTPTIKDAPKTP